MMMLRRLLSATTSAATYMEYRCTSVWFRTYSDDTKHSVKERKRKKKKLAPTRPPLVENELTEKYIKGWGPGGSAVNKNTNAVFLKHDPTGLNVKVHTHRFLEHNRRDARKLLQVKVAKLLHGIPTPSELKGDILRERKRKKVSKQRKRLREANEQHNSCIDVVDGIEDVHTQPDTDADDVDVYTPPDSDADDVDEHIQPSAVANDGMGVDVDIQSDVPSVIEAEDHLAIMNEPHSNKRRKKMLKKMKKEQQQRLNKL